MGQKIAVDEQVLFGRQRGKGASPDAPTSAACRQGAPSLRAATSCAQPVRAVTRSLVAGFDGETAFPQADPTPEEN